MKKTLIASAVAAATLSTGAMAMDQATQLAERLDSMPEFYGNIQLAHGSTTTDNGTTETSTNEMFDNGSTIGVKHDHAISDGLTGFFKAEFHFDADGSKYHNDGGNSANQSLGEELDEAYIGVKGDFGSIQVGADDTVYEWVDMMDSGEAFYIEGGISVDTDTTEGDNIQYVSPQIADGLKVGLTYPVDSDTQFGGSLAAMYEMDNLSVALGYSMGREENGTEAGDTIGLAGSFALDDLTLIAQYETRGETKVGGVDQSDDTTFWGLEGIYAMGQNQFILGYGMTTIDDAADTETSAFELQALHNLSDHMYVYLEYVMSTTEATGSADVDVDALALGATYAF